MIALLRTDESPCDFQQLAYDEGHVLAFGR